MTFKTHPNYLQMAVGECLEQCNASNLNEKSLLNPENTFFARKVKIRQLSIDNMEAHVRRLYRLIRGLVIIKLSYIFDDISKNKYAFLL